MQAEKYFLSRFFNDGPFSAGSKLRKLSLFMSFLVVQAEKYFLSPSFFMLVPFLAVSKLQKLSLFMPFLVVQATKVNCPGSSADGNVLAFNNNTKTCDWASNVPGCGAERY